MDEGSEPIADPAELAQVRRQARAVHLKAAVTALLLTLLVMVF